MFNYLIVILFLFTFLSYFNCDKNICFNNNLENLNEHFATKTPYRFRKNLNETKLNYPGCKPVKIWGIVRHGSRNPSKKNIRQMNTDLVEIRNKILLSTTHQLCESDLELLRNWRSDYKIEEAKYLVEEGKDEMIELAERMQNRLPDLFPEDYNNLTYKFKFTKTQRTEESFKNFATGLFGRQNIKQIWYAAPEHQDRVLRFYKRCEKWKTSVDKNPDALKEVNEFAKTTLMETTVQNIGKKIGLNGNLTWNDVHLMYTTCAFETAKRKFILSPWCIVFDKETIKIFEFLEDLEYFWIDGYGYSLTYLQSCPAIIDMLNHINLNSTNPDTTIYFSHSGTILKLLAKFGLYKDAFKLSHKDFNRERKWRVSEIDAFASNIFIVLYSCSEDSTLKVLILHQEKPVHLNGCPTGIDLCDYETFTNIFKDDYENCNFDEMCLYKKGN